MPVSRIVFGPWEPDKGPTNNDGVLDAFNVYPHPNGYRPSQSLIDRSSLSAGATITSSQVFGAMTFVADDGNPMAYIGTTGKIWGVTLSGASPAAVDLSNASISNSGSGNQMFARYGSLIIWTNMVIPPQKSTLTLAMTVFQALGGTPPTAQYVAVIRDFTMFGKTQANPRLLTWSALGNPEDYVASATTQSDSQSINDEGPIAGLVGGEYGIVFFRYAAYRITYIGAPVIFQFDKITTSFELPGAIPTGSNAVVTRHGHMQVRLGDDVYFITTQGLAVISGGQVFRNLSKGRNSNYFVKRVGSGASLSRIMMIAADPAHSRIAIGFQTASGSNHSIEQIMVYDAILDRFSRISMDASFIFSGYGYSSQPVGPANFMFIRASTGQLAVQAEIQAISINAPNDAFIETADFQHVPGQRAFVNSVRPMTEHVGTTGVPMIQVGTRSKQSQSISYSLTVTVNANGEAPQRASGRFHRYKCLMSISATWSFMPGIEVNYESDGER